MAGGDVYYGDGVRDSETVEGFGAVAAGGFDGGLRGLDVCGLLVELGLQLSVKNRQKQRQRRNAKSNSKGKSNSRSLRDDKQKNKQRQGRNAWVLSTSRRAGFSTA